MYRTDDKCAAIRTAQSYLYEIALEDGDLPRVAPDGVFGKESRDAVIAFQKKHGLAATGEIDRETFDLLYRERERVRRRRGRTREYPRRSSEPLKPGDTGADVEALNILLSEIAEDYLFAPPHGSVFSKETEDAVKLLEARFGMPKVGEVGDDFLDRLIVEIFARGEFKKVYT